MIKHISVIGNGYVGSSLARAAQSAGYDVIAIDLNNHSAPYDVFVDYEHISSSDAIFICLPTPMGNDSYPDNSALFDAAEKIAKNMKEGAIVVVESTVAIGTTKKIAAIIASQTDKDFSIAYCPERIDPGNPKWNIKNTTKIVASEDPGVINVLLSFYHSFIIDTVVSKSIEEAEAAKLLENTFRLVNISLVNELSILFDKIGININEVVGLASSKDFGYMPFSAGIGAGGHCIPVDPQFLSSTAKHQGIELPVLNAAKQINDFMPEFYLEKANEALGGLAGKKIIVVGISYKPNVSDMRESRSWRLIEMLREAGANVYWHDEVVNHHYGEYSQGLQNDTDLGIIVHRHKSFNEDMLSNLLVIDCERRV